MKDERWNRARRGEVAKLVKQTDLSWQGVVTPDNATFLRGQRERDERDERRMAPRRRDARDNSCHGAR